MTEDAPDPRRTDLLPHPDTLPTLGPKLGTNGAVVMFPTRAEAEAYAAHAGLPADVVEDPRAVWLRVPADTFEAGLFDLLNTAP